MHTENYLIVEIAVVVSVYSQNTVQGYFLIAFSLWLIDYALKILPYIIIIMMS